MKGIKWITIAIAALLLLLVAQNNFAFSQSTKEQPIPKIPKVNVNFPDPVPDVDTEGSTQEIMDIWRRASKALDNIAPSGVVLDSFITGSIDLCTNLINSIIGSGFNVATITGLLQSCAAGAAGLIGGLGGIAGAVFSTGVSLLNAIGSAFVLFLQGIGFTIEGILGLAAIGAVLSLIVNIVNFAYTTIMGVVNLAYTSGVGGIAIASLLLALINMALSAVLIVIDIILLISVTLLFVLSGIFFLALTLAAPIVFFLTGFIFLLFGIVTLGFKLQSTLANLAAFPTGLLTFAISLFTSIINVLSLAFIMLLNTGGVIGSLIIGIVMILAFLSLPIISLAIAFVIFVSIVISIGFVAGLIVLIFALFFLGLVAIGAILCLLIPIIGILLMWVIAVFGAAIFFLIGAPISVVVYIFGIILGLIIGTIAGAIVFAISFLILLFIFAIVFFIVIPAIYMLTLTINLFLSIMNFGEIMIESIVGVLTIIVNSVMLMILKMFVDLLEITAISEIVSVIVMFLQRIQESAPLTKIIAYPLEMCIGIAMLLFAIVLAGCNIVLYPVNFVWQFISRSLSSCYRIMCGPFLRPLGYEVSWI